MNGAHTKYRGTHRDIGDGLGPFDCHDGDNIVLRILKSILYCAFLWVFNTCNFSVYVAKKQYIAVRRHQPVRYDALALTSLTSKRLHAVRRKIMVLDLDETLIHSHHDIAFRADANGRGTTPDYILKVTIDNQPVRFFVHFRPHVDYFLSVVSEWFDLVVFTASMEIYGSSVADLLDRGRGILRRRYFRQHCTMEYAGYTKDLSAVHSDLSSIFILDNSPTAYRNFSHNAIPIKSWFNDPTDTCLLNLLPVLDALRFTSDVRSILSRNLCRVPPSNAMRSSFPV